MPRSFPPSPDFPQDGGAERAIREALRDQLPDDVVVLHGVHLQEYEQEHETKN
ncbi:hypothetical protein [Isoptericola chiayiensis]|nr:hypothetical protein [Isoptericola chiayiensis]NOW02224.1 hypothetical protein [Isoptericola chiayiensis]